MLSLLLAQVDGAVQRVKGDRHAAAVDGPFQSAARMQPSAAGSHADPRARRERDIEIRINRAI